MDNGSQGADGGAGGAAVTGSTRAAGRRSDFAKWKKSVGGGWGGSEAPY